MVGRVEAVVIGERVRDGVPVAGVVAAAVDEERGRLRFVAPDDVVQLQPLRREVARLRFDGATSYECFSHRFAQMELR